jgi:hypothetical protein
MVFYGSEDRVGGERTTCASTASSLNLRRANAQRPLTHSHALRVPTGFHLQLVRSKHRPKSLHYSCSADVQKHEARPVPPLTSVYVLLFFPLTQGPIWQSIEWLDQEAIKQIETVREGRFL